MTNKEMETTKIAEVKTVFSEEANGTEGKKSSRRKKKADIVNDAFALTYEAIKERARKNPIAIDENGKVVTGGVMIPRNMLVVDKRYQKYRFHKKINKLLEKFDYAKLLPIVVVPRDDEKSFAVVDGQGRDMIAKIKSISALFACVILNAPQEPEARLKYEAEYFASQGRDDEKMKETEKHPSRVIGGDVIATIVDDVCKRHQIAIVNEPGKRTAKTLGSYRDACRLAKKCGEDGLEYAFTVIEKAGWDEHSNGYSASNVKSLANIYKMHPDNAKETEKYLGVRLRQVTPQLFSSNARSCYPMRDYRDACMLHLEDIVCSGLGLERKIWVENDKVKRSV